jgi:hypothetical protein
VPPSLFSLVVSADRRSAPTGNGGCAHGVVLDDPPPSRSHQTNGHQPNREPAAFSTIDPTRRPGPAGGRSRPAGGCSICPCVAPGPCPASLRSRWPQSVYFRVTSILLRYPVGARGKRPAGWGFRTSLRFRNIWLLPLASQWRLGLVAVGGARNANADCGVEDPGVWA